MYLTFMLFLVQASQDKTLPVRQNLETDFKSNNSPSNNAVMMLSYRKTCTLFLLSFKIQSNLNTPSSTSSNVFPIPSLVNFGRNKGKKPSGDIRWRRRENTAQAPAKNLRIATIQLRLKISSFLVTGSKCGTNTSHVIQL